MDRPPPPSARLNSRAQAALQILSDRGLARTCPPIEARRGTHYRLRGRELIGFCSNDYLGLAAESLAQPTAPAATPGAGASQLISGRQPIHREVEALLAEMSGCEDAVLFPSAYQANLGLLPLLLREGDRVYSDRLNHASLIDGMRLSQTRPTILPHLQAPPSSLNPTPRALPEGAARWWICESVFSMDGTRPAATALDRFQNAGGWLYMDDAHAFGLGPGGAGRNHELTRAADISILGLGKAIGRAGGAVAASAATCEWIRSACRSFVFSTALSPALTQQIHAALEQVRGNLGDERRAALQHNCARVAGALGRIAAHYIVPLWVGDNARALAWSRTLEDMGLHVQAIRPPTVPEGEARLRLTLSAAHSERDLDLLLQGLESSTHALGIAWPPPPRNPNAPSALNKFAEATHA